MPRADLYRIVLDFIRQEIGRIPSGEEVSRILEQSGPEGEEMLLRLRHRKETLFQIIHRLLSEPEETPPTTAVYLSDSEVRAIRDLWREASHLDLSPEEVTDNLKFRPEELDALRSYIEAKKEVLRLIERLTSRTDDCPVEPEARDILSATLQSLRPGSAHRVRNLLVIPLYRDEPTQPCLLLCSAIKEGMVEVTEVSETGSVPQVLVHNHSEKPVLILEGEILEGAKQSRTTNIDILVPSKSELVIPVSCIERGRWHYHSRHFSSKGTVVHPRLRAEISRQVTLSLERTGNAAAQQGRVWDMVAMKRRAMRASSPTESLSEVFEETRPKLSNYEELIPRLKGAQGLMALIEDVVVLVEVFETAHQFELMTEGIIHSLASDALERRRPERRRHPHTPSLEKEKDEKIRDLSRTILRDLADFAAVSTKPGIGLGTNIRIWYPNDVPSKRRTPIGAALTHQGRLVHLTAYPHLPLHG